MKQEFIDHKLDVIINSNNIHMKHPSRRGGKNTDKDGMGVPSDIN